VEVSINLVQLDREYLVAVVRDITERKQAEESLRESETRFRQLAENIQEVFWMTNPAKNEMLYVSPAFETVWGRSRQSLYAAPNKWMEAIHPDDRARVQDDIFGKQERGDYNITYRILRPDGEVRWIHDRAFPIRDQEGRVYRIVGTAADITQQHKLEEQIRQAQKMEAMGTLAGGIAHDFNNILAAMNGYTELAKMSLGESNPRVGECLDYVLQAGGRATSLVRQILTFSRQEEQQRRLIQLRDVVQESISLLRATIPTTIEFKTFFAPDLPTVLADSSQIHQVLMNLGTNAWHAMKNQTGRLEIKLESFVADAHAVEAQPRLRIGHFVRISLTDTGAGMDKATVERIFEPFFTTKGPGEGTGLGLSVVYGIIQNHEGVITVYSQPGEGTTFHLYFPSQLGEAAKAPATDGPFPQGQGKRVLFVDDEDALAQLGKKTLEQLGYQVEALTSVAEAIELVRADPQRFDLVITDQTMPGMTGADFAGQLHKIRPDLPIILATGYSASLTPERLRSLGIRELLLKPQTVHSLATAAHRALTEKKPG
jgi:PAS domain S-box-containing protein